MSRLNFAVYQSRARKSKGRIDAKGGVHEVHHSLPKPTESGRGFQKQSSNACEFRIKSKPTERKIRNFGFLASKNPHARSLVAFHPSVKEEGQGFPGSQNGEGWRGIFSWMGRHEGASCFSRWTAHGERYPLRCFWGNSPCHCANFEVAATMQRE